MRKKIVFILLSIALTACEKMFIGNEPENTPVNNFNILWKTFDENYAMFGVRHINWDSLYSVYSSKISDQTSEAELWNISAGLLSNLDDGHVCLLGKGWNKSAQSSKIIQTRNADDFSLELVRTNFIQSSKTVGAGNITYGLIKNENTGYIHISNFRSAGTGNGYDWAYDIDKALSELAACNALIVDVRNNTGGLIVTESIISSAFTDHKIIFFYSRRKTGPAHDNFGELRPVSVEPRSGSRPFTKKIAFLTNRFTASGGEYMTQLFKNLPNSVQIGDTTLGAFGEITNTAELPNGWTFLYPCTLTTLPDGSCLEGVGIVPDILIENTKADIDAKRDNVLNYAINFLK
jgi:carboxyl-terminal processing protease